MDSNYLNGYEPLTRSDVESNSYTTRMVREQAVSIRQDLSETGRVSWTGRGYHRSSVLVRDFALRVLVAKGEIVRDSSDPRVHVSV